MRKWLAYTIPIGPHKKTYLLIAAAILAVTAAGCGSRTTTTTSSTASNNTGSSNSGPAALWVANQTGSSVTAYATSDLSAGGSISPAATISGSNAQFVDPFCSAFDSNGNLWVVDRVGSKQASKIEEFTASSAASGGNLTPAVTIAGSNTTLPGAAGFAFDSSGNFWVADDDGSPNTVVAFSPSQLATGGDIASTIELTSSDICNPIGLTFDKNGNLWVTSELGNYVDEFRASDLTSGGTITPNVVISGSNTMLDQPIGLAFDTNGNLWVAQQNSSTLVMYGASKIAASGNPAPDTTVLGTNTGLASPANILFH